MPVSRLLPQSWSSKGSAALALVLGSAKASFQKLVLATQQELAMLRAKVLATR